MLGLCVFPDVLSHVDGDCAMGFSLEEDVQLKTEVRLVASLKTAA